MKTILSILGICLMSGFLFANSFPINSNLYSNVNLESVIQEAHAFGPEGCLTTPGSNTGICKQNVSGAGWNCVADGWFEVKNCSGD